MPKLKSVLRGSDLDGVIDDVTLNQAFKLAHSIYRYREANRKIALDIVRDAVKGVEVRLLTQQEADRHDPQKPTKVRWSTLQWLQLLIYCKSEVHEKRQEAGKLSLLTDEDMIIRYVKHLVLATCRRNSFHITLGLSRLLYAYSAAETMAIYDLVFQDTDSSSRKSDAYYRARKNKLIEELEKRFRRFIRIDQGSRGEKRFQYTDNSAQFSELVVQYLTSFTPWETSCPLPASLDAWSTVPSLQSSQQNQIHSLIHPSCFTRITKALKLDAPGIRLALPKFFLTSQPPDRSSPPDENSSSELTRQEATEIRNEIVEEARNRKKFVARSLSVLVDGVEHARLDLAESSQVRFNIEESATLIELVGHNEEGELLLATHVIAHDEDEFPAGESKRYSVILEGGQATILTTFLLSGDANDSLTLVIEISYRETALARLVAAWWQKFNFRSAQLLSPATVGAALALLVLVALIVLFATRNRTGEYIAQQPTPLASVELPIAATPSSPQVGPSAQSSPTSSKSQTPNARSSPGSSTREPTARAVKSLSEVERIFVGSLGNDAFSQSLRQRLIEKLQAGSGFVVTADPNDADTAISGSARQTGHRKDQSTGHEVEIGSVSLKLVNVLGEIIWRTKKYVGTPEQAVTQFRLDLLAAIEADKRKPKQ